MTDETNPVSVDTLEAAGVPEAMATILREAIALKNQPIFDACQVVFDAFAAFDSARLSLQADAVRMREELAEWTPALEHERVRLCERLIKHGHVGREAEAALTLLGDIVARAALKPEGG